MYAEAAASPAAAMAASSLSGGRIEAAYESKLGCRRALDPKSSPAVCCCCCRRDGGCGLPRFLAGRRALLASGEDASIAIIRARVGCDRGSAGGGSLFQGELRPESIVEEEAGR